MISYAFKELAKCDSTDQGKPFVSALERLCHPAEALSDAIKEMATIQFEWDNFQFERGYESRTAGGQSLGHSAQFGVEGKFCLPEKEEIITVKVNGKFEPRETSDKGWSVATSPKYDASVTFSRGEEKIAEYSSYTLALLVWQTAQKFEENKA